MKYDLIMVVASRDRSLIDMTQRAIDSCLADGADVNVILIETFRKTHYRGVSNYILYTGPFNYNRCLNEGLKHRAGDIQILANNDLIFHKGWSEIGGIMRENEIVSASALSNAMQHRHLTKGYNAYKGYTVGLFFTGWCIFQHKDVWPKIGQLDEYYEFWFSDNVHAEQLKAKGIEHWLICAVQVDHITSQTLVKTDRKLRQRYTHASQKRLHRNN